VVTKIIPHGTCTCGKGLYTIAEADALVKHSNTLRRFYRCELAPFNRAECYHVTKSRKQGNKGAVGSRFFQFHPERILRELNSDMATRTLRMAIIEIMEESYKKFGNYKHTTKSLTAILVKERATWTKGNVASELSTMKKLGLIVQLDKVPNARGASYIGLVSILEHVTKPTQSAKVESAKPVEPNKPKPIIPMQATKEAAVVTTAKHAPLPTDVPNPFDKVNTKLDQIAAAVQGLAQGYSEMVKPNLSVDNERLKAELNELRLALARATPPVDTAAIINGLQKYLGEVNSSLIDEFRLAFSGANQAIFKQVNDLMLSVDGSEDYKRGLKDGITLAIEMGLEVNK
jgi:hypothetical protein